MSSFAIVIPAFKLEFLERALASLYANDLTDTTIYVADDASPQPIKSVVDRWTGRLPIRYVRFPENLGGHNLAAHWNRSVRLSSEPWVWLPGDDDEFEPDCVQSILARIRSDGDAAGDLYRLNVIRIDADSMVTEIFNPFPASLNATDFLRHKLEGGLRSFAPEYVFRRAAWDAIDGFVQFPLAWCSDDATWALLSRRSGITTIEGPRMRWRQSGLNISSPSAKHVAQKAEAAALFINWLRDHYHLLDSKSSFENSTLFDPAMTWLHWQIGGKLKGWPRNKALAQSLYNAKNWRVQWGIAMMKRIHWERHARSQRGLMNL